MMIVNDAIAQYWSDWTQVRYGGQSSSSSLDSCPLPDMTFETNEKVARRMFFDLPQKYLSMIIVHKNRLINF